MLENRKIEDSNINMNMDIENSYDSNKYVKGSLNKKDSELIFKEIDGLDIRSFAKEYNLSLKEVETMVRNNLLISRYQNGMLYVYDNRGSGTKDDYDYIAELKDVSVDVLDDSLKNLDIKNQIDSEDKDIGLDERFNLKDTQTINYYNSYKDENINSINNNSNDNSNVNNIDNIENTQNTYHTLPSINNINDKEGIKKYDDSLNTMGYLAVLAENLKVSKQEQIELLKLTQESIKRVVESTEKLVETKNSIIQEKDKIISSLEEKLSLSNKKVTLALQENEDLKILVDTLENR